MPASRSKASRTSCTPATRSPHLEIWQQIISRRPSPTTSVGVHFDFIDCCVEKLDNIGFRWDKDSILGILYQIGLSSLPSKKPAPVDTNGMTACEIKQALETKQASRPCPLSLMPDEIIDKIIGHLELIDEDEYESKPHHDDDDSLQRSLKSFALISRRFWEISRPRLWEAARFPPSSDATMNDWARNILPKHGSFVRSISVDISEREMHRTYTPKIEGRALKTNSTRPPNPTRFKEDDSLSQADESDNNFLTTLIKSLALCPNASSLKINLSFHSSNQDNSMKEMEIFLLKLIPQISGLKGLRHISLKSWFTKVIMSDFLPQFIKSLPVLESFANTGFTASIVNGGQKSFESDLALKLRHLSTLEIHDIPLDDPIWHLEPRPQHIKTLRLSYTADQIPSAAVIHHIAPKVEKLCMHELSSYGRAEENVAPITTGLTSNDRLILPFLHDLEICSPKKLLICFTSCKALRQLCLLNDSSLEDFRVVDEFLRASSWPHIESVDLFCNRYSRLSDTRFDYRTRKSLQTFCDQSNIKLSMCCLLPQGF